MFNIFPCRLYHANPSQRQRGRENKQRFIHRLLPNQGQSSHTARQVSAWQAGCEGVEAASYITQTLGDSEISDFLVYY